MGLSQWIGGVCVASARWVRGQGLPSKLRADSLARWAEEREVVVWLVGYERLRGVVVVMWCCQRQVLAGCDGQ